MIPFRRTSLRRSSNSRIIAITSSNWGRLPVDDHTCSELPGVLFRVEAARVGATLGEISSVIEKPLEVVCGRSSVGGARSQLVAFREGLRSWECFVDEEGLRGEHRVDPCQTGDEFWQCTPTGYRFRDDAQHDPCGPELLDVVAEDCFPGREFVKQPPTASLKIAEGCEAGVWTAVNRGNTLDEPTPLSSQTPINQSAFEPDRAVDLFEDFDPTLRKEDGRDFLSLSGSAVAKRIAEIDRTHEPGAYFPLPGTEDKIKTLFDRHDLLMA